MHYNAIVLGFLFSNQRKILSELMQENEERRKYASVYKELNLPRKKHITPVAEGIFVTNMVPNHFVTPAIKESRFQLLDNIEKELQIFEDAQGYRFKFPQSKFPEVHPGQRNNISYEMKIEVEDEDTFKDRLSNEQVEQIRERGEFQVKSSMRNVTIPYVWKINDFLLRGKVNIVNIWENGLAACYTILQTAKDNFVSVIPRNLNKLVHLPSTFFAIIFGKRALTQIWTPPYTREVFKDFWTDIMNNELKDLKNQMGHEFLERLYLKYEPALYEDVQKTNNMSQATYNALRVERDNKINLYNGRKNNIEDFKQSLTEVESKFRDNWMKIRRKILAKVSNEIQSAPGRSLNQSEEDPLTNQKTQRKDQAIVEKLYEEKYLLYTAHLKEHLPKKNMTTPVIEALITIITIVNLIQEKTRRKNEKQEEVKSKIQSDIYKKYRIRSKNDKFRNRLTEEQYRPIFEQIESQFYQKLFEAQIGNIVNQKYQSIYKKYVTLKKNFDTLVEQKKRTLKAIYVPERVFYSTYRLLPPYLIRNSGGYYTMDKEREMKIDTSTNFWKFKLYGMRLKSWTINCAVFLIGFAWVGPFGLRCLFGVQQFKYDEYCDYYNGGRLYYTRKTVLGTFSTVLDGIKRSRDHFESLPDRGLFGKKFSRIFNYIQCYVFRLFIVGIVGTLIIYPILIIVLSLLCIVMVVTVWIWVPLIMVVCYLFNILVFQFESSSRPSGILIRGVPLLSLAIAIIVSMIQILFSLINLILIAPIVTTFYFLFLVLQRGFRTFTDTIMIVIIAKLGRVPSRDTSIARKISGPGMSRSYYCSILQDDVYVLTQAELQQIFVRKFIELTREQIDSHTEKYNSIMRYVMEPFGYSSPNINYDRDMINRNKGYLMQNFNNASNNYLARYPNHPYNVRFTQEEIDQYFENSVKIVKNFVERHQIQDWIFDQRSVLNEDYDELTRSLWISIFSCGQQIFQPLETIDTRFKMTDDVTSNSVKMRQNVGSVMKALEGEIKLSQRAADFSPAKTSLLEKDREINLIRTICSLHSSNSGKNMNIDISDPCLIIVSQRNLEELKKYDEYQRNRVKKGNEKIFEE